MIVLECIYAFLILTLSVVVSASDLKGGIIRNRTLIIFALIFMAVDIVYYGCFARDLVGLYLENVAVIVCVSLFLYASHSFAGGDCKLAIVLALGYPANYYLEYGSLGVTLIVALGIAILLGYCYLLVYSLMKAIHRESLLSVTYVKNCFWSFLKSYMIALVYISGVHLIEVAACFIGINIPSWMVSIICIGVAWMTGRYGILRRWHVVLGVIVLDVAGAICLKTIPFSINVWNYVFVLVLLSAQMIIRTCLYESVSIEKLEKGMILTAAATIPMQGSRVKGLPKISTEDLRSRLSPDEVNSIKRWAKSRGIGHTTIVRKIPFAIFLALGYWLYFLVWCFAS